MNDSFNIQISAAGFTDIGPTREENQDAILMAGVLGTGNSFAYQWQNRLGQKPVSFAVIDGMGGYKGGADASAICGAFLASRHVASSTDEANGLFETLSAAVSSFGRVIGSPHMGAAFAMLTIENQEVRFANVGDCRIMSVSGNAVGQVTVDDRVDEESSGLTQAIGASQRLDAHFYSKTLNEGRNRFLMCSDGVWSTLGNEEMRLFATSSSAIGEICGNVRNRLYELSATDNCSVILVDVIVEKETARDDSSCVEADCELDHTSIVF